MPPPPDLAPYRAVKRTIDLVGAVGGLLMLAPVLAAAALAVRLTSRGPAFFAQERTGLHGRPFRVLKFRTMAGTPRVEVGRETLADDPRITPVGRLLRRTGIDELPQLWNVLIGDMSLVGPRPLLAWENALCDARQARRLDVPPGITGLAQVNGRNAIPWPDRIAWDVLYVERASLALDLLILLRTLPVALCGQDAYAPDPLAPGPEPAPEGLAAIA